MRDSNIIAVYGVIKPCFCVALNFPKYMEKLWFYGKALLEAMKVFLI